MTTPDPLPDLSPEQVVEVAGYAARWGDLHTLRCLLRHFQLPAARMGHPVHLAILFGHLHVVQYLVEEFKLSTNGVSQEDKEVLFSNVDVAARAGHMDIVKYLLQNFPKPLRYKALAAFDGACEVGNLELVRYLVEALGLTDDDIRSRREAVNGAVRGGHLDVFKYLQWFGFSTSMVDDAFETALAAGHLHMLEYITKSFQLGLEEGALVRCRLRASAAGRADIAEFIRTHLCALPTARELYQEVKRVVGGEDQ